MAIVLTCFNCKKSLSFADFVPFKDTCEKCNSDVHCCKNCKFYDPSAYNSCKEPQAERVLEKERSNFCDLFRASEDNSAQKGSSLNNQQSSAKSKLEDLFKK